MTAALCIKGSNFVKVLCSKSHRLKFQPGGGSGEQDVTFMGEDMGSDWNNILLFYCPSYYFYWSVKKNQNLLEWEQQVFINNSFEEKCFFWWGAFDMVCDRISDRHPQWPSKFFALFAEKVFRFFLRTEVAVPGQTWWNHYPDPQSSIEILKGFPTPHLPQLISSSRIIIWRKNNHHLKHHLLIPIEKEIMIHSLFHGPRFA